MEGDHYVTVHVSTELLAELGEWSKPVEVKIIETPEHGTGWEMVARRRDPIAYKAQSFGAELILDPAQVTVVYRDEA